MVHIDKINIFFDMESRSTLAYQGDMVVFLMTTGTSMQCTVLFGFTLNRDKLTPLVVFNGKPDGRVARIFNGMPAFIKYICQENVWVDQKVF